MTTDTHAPEYTKASRYAQEFADPSTPETFITRAGIANVDELRAVMARTGKSHCLLAVILIGIGFGDRVTADDARAAGVSMLTEPALNTLDLHYLASIARRWHDWDQLAAVCAHPQMDQEALISNMWTAPISTVQATGQAGGSLLPGATWWVRAAVASGAQPGPRGSTVEDPQRDQIADLAAQWLTRAGGNDAIVAFLAAQACAFTDQNLMFAAAATATAPPQQ